MDDCKKLSNEIDPSVDGLNGLILNNDEASSSFDSYYNNLESESLCDVLKCFLLKAVINGADKVLKDGKSRKAKSKQSMQHYGANMNNKTPTSWTNQVGHDDRQCTFQDDEVGQFPFINIIYFLAVLAFKFAGFQFNLLVGFLTFPIWLSYFSFMFLMFPFRVMRYVRGYLMKKLVITLAATTLKAQKSVGSMVMRFGSALFWAVYVCSMLLGLLISGFVFGGVVMRCLVEKPIQISANLNFDYMKSSPVAFMPLMSSASFGDPQHYIQKTDEKIVSTHTIPYNHKLQLIVALTVPESEYNRKLGVFQVRVEFLSANGKVTATSSYPCMLQFKSHTIRFAETMIRSVPLLAGLQSESQILNIKMNEFREGLEPTACLKVILEQRAEYRPSAGIPEIYAASLALESELPPLKRVIWNWRRTMFVWASLSWFLTELVVILLFCRPMIMPGGNTMLAYEKKGSQFRFISWNKSI